MDLLLLRDWTDCIPYALERHLSTNLAPILPKGEQDRLHPQILADVRRKPSLFTLRGRRSRLRYASFM